MSILLDYLRKMSWKKNLRPSSLTFLFPVTLILFLVCSDHIVTKTDDGFYTATFQKQLISQEDDLFHKLTSLVAGLGLKETNYKTFNEIAKQHQDKSTNFFVYKNKTLIRWTSSEVIVPVAFSDSLTKTTITWFTKGHYLVKHVRKQNYDYLALQLIRSDYPFRNDYLISRFNTSYKLPQETEISDKVTPYKVYSKNKDASLYLDFPKTETNQTALIFTYITFLLLIILVAQLIYNYLKFKHKSFELKQFLIYFLLLAFIRIGISFIPIPTAFAASQLFSPFLYASSDLLPSLGHLIINTLFILLVAVAYYNTLVTIIDPKYTNPKKGILLFYVVSVIIYMLSFQLITLIDSFVSNSNIPLNLSNIFSTNIYSFIIILILFLLSISYYLLLRRYYIFHYKNFNFKKLYLIICSFSAFLTLLFFDFEIRYVIPNIVILFFQILLISNQFSLRAKNSLVYQLFILLLLSLFTSSILYNSTQLKEKETRKSLAYKLTAKRDKLAEFLYPNIEKAILQDALIKRYLNLALTKSDSVPILLDKVKSKFATNYWNKYEVQAYICHTENQLEIKPTNLLVSCKDYFTNRINKKGIKTISNHLYYIDESYDLPTYISKIEFPYLTNAKHNITIYLEFYSKITTSSLGYPELLIDNEFYQRIDLSEYSYAIYHQNDLVNSVGDYKYQLTLNSTNPDIHNSLLFFDKANYNHLYVKTPAPPNIP